MKNNVFLTVVVAAYNVQDYIVECINSLIFKSINVEILVINDASSDDTFNKIKEFENIKIINLENNKGISDVRNLGINLACGKYVTFIDGDDRIDSGQLEKFLLSYNEDTDIDIFIGNYVNYLEDEDKYYENITKYNGKFMLSGQDLLANFMLNSISGSVWKCIFRKSFLVENNLKFLSKIVIAEDVEFLVRGLVLAKKAVLNTEIKYYFYRIRQNSVMKTIYTLDKYQSSMKVVNSLLYLVNYGSSINAKCKNKINEVLIAVFLQAIGSYNGLQSINIIKKISNDIQIRKMSYKMVLFGLRYIPEVVIYLLRFKYR